MHFGTYTMFFMHACMAASAGVSQVSCSANIVLNLQANFFSSPLKGCEKVCSS